MNSLVKDAVKLMGGARVLKHRVDSLTDLDAAIRSGLPVAALDAVVASLAPDDGARKELTERIVARATYSRHARKPLSAEKSGAVARFARIAALALEVWGSKDAAWEFINAPHPELDDKAPLTLMTTDAGARAVEETLQRLLHDLPA